MQDLAECGDRVGTDVLVIAQPSQLPGTDVVVFDQRILGNSLLPHNLPEFFVRNHYASLTFLLAYYPKTVYNPISHILLI